MTIRKFWKKIVLVSTALFWASCNDDSGTEPVVEPTVSSSSVEQNNDNSSADGAEDPNAASEMSSAEESGSSAVNACEDTATYPYVKAGTEIRCNEVLALRDGYNQMRTYSCCDGTYETLSESNVRNDTLLTDSIVKAEKIDTLNATYCKDNGGVKDFTTYTSGSVTVSTVACNNIAKEKAVELYKDSVESTEEDSVLSCLESLTLVEALYGVTISSQESASLATVTCMDETVISTAAYTREKNSYEKRIANCEANAQEVINSCATIAAGDSSSSSVLIK